MNKSRTNWCRWYVSNKTCFISCLLSIMLITLVACNLVRPSKLPIQQPTSPLIPGTNSALATNRWRLVEATYLNKIVEFDVIQPIYITFTNNGQLIKRTTNCNSGGYFIIAESVQHYYLVPGAETAKGCGDMGNKQYAQISEAIAATTEYIIEGNQLLLLGNDVQIVLNKESQLLPTANETLTENNWRIVEIDYNNKILPVDRTEPIYVDFYLAGVNILYKECYLASYRITEERELRYQLVEEEAAYANCDGEVTRYNSIVDAVAATNKYELQGNQLFLTGDGVRITLEVDNPQ